MSQRQYNTTSWLSISNYNSNIVVTIYREDGDVGGDGLYFNIITTADEIPSPSYVPTIEDLADRIMEDPRHSRRSARAMARRIKETIILNCHWF